MDEEGCFVGCGVVAVIGVIVATTAYFSGMSTETAIVFAKYAAIVIIAVASLPFIGGVLFFLTAGVQDVLEAWIAARVKHARIKHEGNPVNHITLNLSGGQVGNINFGKVVGSINSSITTLSEQGNESVIDAIRALTEGIAKSQELESNDAGRVVGTLRVHGRPSGQAGR